MNGINILIILQNEKN